MSQAWPLAIVFSLGFHGLALTAAALHWRAREYTQQTPSEAQINISDQQVTASTAKPAEFRPEPASAASPKGSVIGDASIPHSSAVISVPQSVAAHPVSALPVTLPSALPAETVSAASIKGSVVGGASIRHSTAVISVPQSVAARPISAPPVTLPSRLPAEPASAAPPKGPLIGEGAIPKSSAIVTVPQSTVARPVAATPVTLPAPLAAEFSGALPSDGTKLASAPLEVAAAVQATTIGQPASAVSPPSEHGTASLAWTGLDASLDPVSLSAIQVFMQPSDPTVFAADKGGLRDGIAETLNAVPCARLQTSFNPTTGTIELRGHLPEDSLRADVLKSLQAQVGSGIPVTDRMQLLPRPQCQLLGAISDVGMAQSTEQETNPRVVGADTFVRQYSLTAGQQLVFEMTAPDYPSVIYVDYFDAEGSVLHMQPNSQVRTVLSPAKSTLAVGQEAPGKPALRLIVGPPFGQEIAVAFAASVPLYAGVRPTVEPAEQYLEFLKLAVMQARKDNPDFKGEWVYFFVETQP